jgi:hypothetical protein
MKFDWKLKAVVPIIVLITIVCGCSGSGGMLSAPDMNAPVVVPQKEASAAENRYLWGLWNIYTEDQVNFEIIPMRFAEKHLNVRSFLEDSPCQSCVQIVSPHKNQDGDLVVTIKLVHPYPGDPTYTAFDIRGIVMFRGNMHFPGLGVRTQGLDTNDPILLNPDGYTRLYNPTEYAPGTFGNTLLEYSKGTFALDFDISATLNPFMNYYTHEERHYFEAGGQIGREYVIQTGPGILNFAYAIDSCWQFPKVNPPIHIPEDFEMSANCPEAYKIVPTIIPFEETLIKCVGDTAWLVIDIYDWQSIDDIQHVYVECPAINPNVLEADLTGPLGDFVRYEILLEVVQPPYNWDEWPLLIGVEDKNPGAPIAYQVLRVIPAQNHAPVAVVEVDNDNPDIGQTVTFSDFSYDIDGIDHITVHSWDTDGDGGFGDAFGKVIHIEYDETGIYNVREKIKDICGIEVISDPISVTVKDPNAIQITLAEDVLASAVGKTYWYYSNFAEFGEYPVDPLAFDGPWDFTEMSIVDGETFRRFISLDDPSVGDIVGYLNPGVEVFQEVSTVAIDVELHVWVAQEFNDTQDVFKTWGMKTIYNGADQLLALPSPIVFPYPLELGYSESDSVGVPGIASAEMALDALGVGMLTVPLGGEIETLLVRMRVQEESINGFIGQGLTYFWYDNDGIIRAFAAATNIPNSDEYNFDWEGMYFTGNAAFYSLYSIEES